MENILKTREQRLLDEINQLKVENHVLRKKLNSLQEDPSDTQPLFYQLGEQMDIAEEQHLQYHDGRAYILLDKNRRIINLNPKAVQMMHIVTGKIFVPGSDIVDYMSVAGSKLESSLHNAYSGIYVKYNRKYEINGELISYLVEYTPFCTNNSTVEYVLVTIEDNTETNYVKAALRESERLLAESQKAAHIGTWSYDLVSKHIYWSDEIYAICEWPIDQPPSLQQQLDLVDPRAREAFTNHILEASKGKSFNNILKIVTPNNNKKYLNMIGSPVFDPIGKVIRITGTALDITANIISEKKLRQSEQMYRLLSENSQDVVCLHDIEGNYTYVSPSITALLGYLPEELIGKSPYDLFHPSDVEEVLRKKHQELLNRKEAIYAQYRIRKKDGEYIWLESNSKVFFNAEGKITGLQSSSRDISERKKNEKDLILFNELINHATDSIRVVDAEGNFIFVNKEGADRIGYTTAELMQMKIQQIEQKISSDAAWQEHIRLLKSNNGLLFIGKNISKDGYSFPVEVSAKYIEIENKGYVVASLRDISERIAAEETLLSSLAEKETLLAEVYHRVKNNLNVIISLLDLQTRRNLDEETLTILRDLKNRIYAMAMVHEKLYQSKDLARIRLSDYIESLTDNLIEAYLIDKPQVKIEIHTDNIELPLDTSIPLGLILNELISNSLKHAFPNNRKGNICIRVDKQSDEEYLMHYQDDGVGFDSDSYYANSTTLGIKLIFLLVKQLKGSIKVSSEENNTSYIASFKVKNKHGSVK